MSELKIPNLNNRSRQYLFKNKLTIKRKSKMKLLSESLFMFISASVLICINYLIPQKKVLINSFNDNIYQIYLNFLNFFNYFYKVLLVITIFVTLIFAVFLLIGATYRLYRTIIRNTKRIKY